MATQLQATAKMMDLTMIEIRVENFVVFIGQFSCSEGREQLLRDPRACCQSGKESER